MRKHLLTYSVLLPIVLAVSAIGAVPSGQKPTGTAATAMAALWEKPDDLTDRDLFYGPWGRENAPDPQAVYTFLHPKVGGINPGVVVRDPAGRQWSVKQAPEGADARRGDEGPVEVVLSRVLWAVGYHQPPVYYLPSFGMKNAFGVKRQPGGRFRLSDSRLKDVGEWSWQENPFVGTKPLQGLLAILLLFNSSDLKNSNNTLYEFRDGETASRWYVVRDLGAALGETAKLAPKRNDATIFANEAFTTGVVDGFVTFNYHGLHKDIIVNRISAADLGWASELLSRLTDRQWRDAFRAGGYAPDVADVFIRTLHTRIGEGLRISGVKG